MPANRIYPHKSLRVHDQVNITCHKNLCIVSRTLLNNCGLGLTNLLLFINVMSIEKIPV